jgi:hypothetical protein
VGCHQANAAEQAACQPRQRQGARLKIKIFVQVFRVAGREIPGRVGEGEFELTVGVFSRTRCEATTSAETNTSSTVARASLEDCFKANNDDPSTRFGRHSFGVPATILQSVRHQRRFALPHCAPIAESVGTLQLRTTAQRLAPGDRELGSTPIGKERPQLHAGPFAFPERIVDLISERHRPAE